MDKESSSRMMLYVAFRLHVANALYLAAGVRRTAITRRATASPTAGSARKRRALLGGSIHAGFGYALYNDRKVKV